MPMTYAMSMSSEVASDTIRINMTTIRVTTVTNRNNTIRINLDSNHNVPWVAVTMNDAATTQMRGAMKSRRSRSWPTCP